MDRPTRVSVLYPAMRLGSGLILVLLAHLAPLVAHAQLPPPGPPTPDQALLREIYKELVAINTTDSVGDTTVAARANDPAAKLSWERTIAFFKTHLA